LLAAFGAADVVAVVAGAAVATTLFRAIGRGFGSGTFGVASAGSDKAAVSTRHVAKAVDRNAAARTVRVTAFLRGESLWPGSPSPI
jgi:FAD/FMN-containing dehydrogenase